MLFKSKKKKKKKSRYYFNGDFAGSSQAESKQRFLLQPFKFQLKLVGCSMNSAEDDR
jgi:hypothetical protein